MLGLGRRRRGGKSSPPIFTHFWTKFEGCDTKMTKNLLVMVLGHFGAIAFKFASCGVIGGRLLLLLRKLEELLPRFLQPLNQRGQYPRFSRRESPHSLHASGTSFTTTSLSSASEMTGTVTPYRSFVFSGGRMNSTGSSARLPRART